MPTVVPFENYQFIWKCPDCGKEIALPVTFQTESGDPICECNAFDMTLIRMEEI